MTAADVKDEMVLAAIICGARASGREVRRMGWGVSEDQVRHSPDGPCCAVGMGVLYGGITCVAGAGDEVLKTFADLHGVSAGFAEGVSDGFEGFNVEHLAPGVFRFTTKDDPVYLRGVSVGQSAYAALVEDAP